MEKTTKSQRKIWLVHKFCVPLHPHSTEKSVLSNKKDRDLAQLVAHTSGGREVAGSSPVIPTERKSKPLIISSLDFFYALNWRVFGVLVIVLAFLDS